MPQFLVWTYSLTWLVQERDWSAAAAGALVAVTHVLGALGPDRGRAALRRRRLAGPPAPLGRDRRRRDDGAARPDRAVALSVVLMVVASTVTVADNGLAFTGVAERAGSYWSGRALGVQNTAQYLTAAAAAPVAAWRSPVGVRRRVRRRGPLPRGRLLGLVPRDDRPAA